MDKKINNQLIMEIPKKEKSKIIEILDFNEWNLIDIIMISEIKDLSYLDHLDNIKYKNPKYHYLFLLDDNYEIYDIYFILDHPNLLKEELKFYLYQGIKK